MVKTNKTAENITKKVKKTRTSKKSLLDYMNVYYNLNTFKGENSKLNLIYFNLLNLFFLIIINLFKYNNGDFFTSPYIKDSLYILFGLPLAVLSIYVLFYIFLNSLENKKKPFIESFLVFSGILFSFLVIGNLITFIFLYVYKIKFLFYFMFILLYIFIAYFLVFSTIQFKRYYETSSFKVLTSYILILIIAIFLFMIYYLNYIIQWV